MHKKKMTTNKSVFKVAKNRLSFAFSKKKSFLSTNKHIEVLDYEEKIVKKKIKLKKPAFYTGLSLSALVITIVSLLFINHSEQIKTGTIQFLAGLGIYTEEVKSVEIESNDYGSPGSWHIDKSAKWIGEGKAEITFELTSKIKESNNQNKDVILVIDRSGSMSGEKIDKVIIDTKELVSYLLTNTQNRVAIVTFDTSSEIKSYFTNNQSELFLILDNISVSGNTNYNEGLKSVDTIMNDYQKEENRDLFTLFLTDGYPNEDTPNQKTTYEILKDKYPYMIINGIQYEMGKDIIDDIKAVSDNQWIADRESLNNVLFEAAINPMKYKKLIINDYISDDFTISTVENVKTNRGEASLTTEAGVPKIIWNLGEDSFATGSSGKMIMQINLKEQYINEEGFFSTNQKESIISQLPEETEKTITSTKTPILKNKYTVYYDSNAPAGCNVSVNEQESYFIYEIVSKKTNVLSCDNYLFNGWDIDSEDDIDINRVNQDTFIMPLHDVHIRGVWTKQNISKSMDGKVYEKTTLYKVLESEGQSGKYAKKFTGTHQDSFNSSLSTKDIYYWKATSDQNAEAILEKNNVIFAGQCWQMIRTTDTGGVKLAYYGEPENGKCLTTREKHPGVKVSNSNSKQMSSNSYKFGTKYTYDTETNKFTLSGDISTVQFTSSRIDEIKSLYTCASSSTTCSTLYYIEGLRDTQTASVSTYTIVSDITRTCIGTSTINGNYDPASSIGYMVGNEYRRSSISMVKSINPVKNKTLFSNSSTNFNYWYADSIDFGNMNNGKYTLVNPYKVESDHPEDIVGKYTLKKSVESSSETTAYYIVGLSGNYMYYVELVGGNLEDELVIGESIIENPDNSYSIVNPEHVSFVNWYANYSNYSHHFICDNNEITCINPRHIMEHSNNYIMYYIDAGEKILLAKNRNNYFLEDTVTIRMDEFYYDFNDYLEYKYTCGNTDLICTEENLSLTKTLDNKILYFYPNRIVGASVSWDGEKYTLEDPLEIEDLSNDSALNSHHFTCSDYGKTTCETVRFIIYKDNKVNTSTYTIELKDGITTSEEALDEMLKTNRYNSAIKGQIDNWYEAYMLNYTEYLDDVIYCNDRSYNNMGAWSSNSSALTTYLTYKGSTNDNNNLKCNQITDQFSVSNNQAKLEYPVGLLTKTEVSLLGNNTLRKSVPTGTYWLMTPYSYDAYWGYGRINYVDYQGSITQDKVHNMLCVRPVITLKNNIEFTQGDGSKEDPYVVDLD